MPTLSQRLFYGIVGVLPYVVIVVGLFSVALGSYALIFFPDRVGLVSAGLPVLMGVFLLWSAYSVLRQRHLQDGDDEA